MSYDSRIILGAQQFDLAGAMNAGLEMAARQKQFDQQNALANLYKTQGANILAGDQNALNALAGFDPSAALGIQSQRQSMAYATEDQEFDRAAAQREAERYAREVGAEKAAADAAELRANTMQALAAPTPEAFDALMIANGQPDMVGQWENRQLLAIPYLELADAIDMIAPKAPEMTPSQKDYKFYADQETAAGRQPLSFNEWDLQSKKAAAPTTTVNTTVGAPGDGSTRPGQVFDAMQASRDTASAAVSGLRALQEAEKALQDGAITGFAADWRLSAAKLGALMGITDPQIIENTETFRSAIAPQVAAMIKATVGSAQLSNADREFAEKAAGGNITLDEGTIKRLLDIMTRASTAAVESHMNRLNLVYPEGSGADRERALFSVTMPSAAPATDSAASGPQPGMVEDGYRFKGGDPADPANWEPVQ